MVLSKFWHICPMQFVHGIRHTIDSAICLTNCFILLIIIHYIKWYSYRHTYDSHYTSKATRRRKNSIMLRIFLIIVSLVINVHTPQVCSIAAKKEWMRFHDIVFLRQLQSLNATIINIIASYGISSLPLTFFLYSHRYTKMAISPYNLCDFLCIPS